MEDFDLYFELIENLGAKDAQKIYARFLHIPILMNALQKEPVFTLINEILRGSPERWTPLNICKIICGIDIKTDLSQVKNGNILINSKNHALEDISTITTSIIIRTIEILKKMSESSLAEILSDGNILDDTSIKVFQSNFLLLVLISEIENSDELYSSIFKLPEHSGWPVYTAKLINYYASENDRDVHGIIFQICEISTRHFLLLIQELEKLGYSNVIEDLSHQYILNNANEFNRILDLEPKTLNETLLHIQELNNLLGILRFGGNEKSISENISGVIDVIKKLTKNLNSFYSENNAQKKNYLFRKNNDLLRLISNFESINSSEEIEARKIGRQILLRMDDIDVFNSIFHKDIGFLISPISLVKIFRNLELIEESFSLAKKLLKLSPYDLDLIGFIASLTFKYGDYRSASKYFKILSARDRISREDKMKFAISNQMIGNWRAAFSLRSEINITDQKN